jgi:hypothetical protein
MEQKLSGNKLTVLRCPHPNSRASAHGATASGYCGPLYSGPKRLYALRGVVAYR